MPVIQSNMYIVIGSCSALVVDPCISVEAQKLLCDFGIKECIILLTHEHYDHTSGVNWLRDHFNCKVICSKTCAELIQDPRKSGAATFSALFLGKIEDQKQILPLLDPNYHCTADFTYERQLNFKWENLPIVMRELPGHSKGSQIISIADNAIFTGDSLIPGQRTITRLPGGSLEIYREIAIPHLETLPGNSIIFPGHENPVGFHQIKSELTIYTKGSLR